MSTVYLPKNKNKEKLVSLLTFKNETVVSRPKETGEDICVKEVKETQSRQRRAATMMAIINQIADLITETLVSNYLFVCVNRYLG